MRYIQTKQKKCIPRDFKSFVEIDAHSLITLACLLKHTHTPERSRNDSSTCINQIRRPNSLLSKSSPSLQGGLYAVFAVESYFCYRPSQTRRFRCSVVAELKQQLQLILPSDRMSSCSAFEAWGAEWDIYTSGPWKGGLAYRLWIDERP